MKTVLKLLAAFALASLSTVLFVQASRTAKEVKLTVENETRHCGVLRQGQTVPIEFNLLNQSSEPIKILEVMPSCTCTVISQSGTEVLAGGNTKIRASYDAHGSRGLTSTSLTVRYQGLSRSQSSYLNLSILAEVEPDYDVSSERLDFPTQRCSTQTVSLKPRLTDHLKIEKAMCDHPAFETKVIAPEAGQLAWLVEVTLDPERLKTAPLIGTEGLRILTDNEHEPVHYVRLFAQ